MKNRQKAVTFYELKWDTEFFGVSSAKAILHMPLSLKEWDNLQKTFKKYQFISITNENSEPKNTQLIGRYTSAILVDINVQFRKKIAGPFEIPKNVTIHRALERNEQIIDIADFKFSKFTEDPELAKRGGNQVYKQWLINSFGKHDKFFALYREKNSDVNGFVLFSFSENASVIELIAVSSKVKNSGIGTRLFKAVEYVTNQQGCNEIRVGTQLRNLDAINFYHKVGCKQTGCHQVYHLWNL